MVSSKVKTAPKHACKSCKKSKVRCFADTVVEHAKCRRCFESDIECVFELQAPRQKRRRIDTRLVDLENQVRTLQQRYDAAHPLTVTKTHDFAHEPCSNTSFAQPSSNETDDGSIGVGQDVVSDFSPPAEQAEPASAHLHSDDEDPIEGYLSSKVMAHSNAVAYLADFMLNLLPEYPIMIIAGDETFDTLRRTRPLLLFAMITAASGSRDQALFTILHTKLTQLLTDKVVIQGEKSIDLLYCTMILEVWYNSPTHLTKLNFYLWIQLAATLHTQLNLSWDRLARIIEYSTHDNLQRPNLQAKVRLSLTVYLLVST